jgi:hypothetical protein
MVAWWDRRVTLFRPAMRQAIRVPATDGNRVAELASGDTVLAAVTSTGTGSVVRVYSMDGSK